MARSKLPAASASESEPKKSPFVGAFGATGAVGGAELNGAETFTCSGNPAGGGLGAAGAALPQSNDARPAENGS